ncbi:amino acid adenylation domain-containing protein [Aquirufa antheringensis]|uniref:amino acid adenylation domain-containing protein n=1 Tax=Aquirufa antheringensis TaxID=2516559 RepID=UPI001032D97D|nr:amino acid adenylation domain-containing protein [Aquirufa antheringensis]TBH71737.1 amino acid adenylation domain-containing protein [Aquirufa antheringensis]
MKCNLIEYFNDTVTKFSDKVSLDDNQNQLTFAELDRYSNCLATAILNVSSSFRLPICVYLPKNLWNIVSFIGIMKSGNFYVPLDVKTPFDRTSKILDKLNSSIIVSNSEFRNKLVQCGFSGHIICIEDELESNLTVDSLSKLESIKNSVIDLDPIYSIFTSGSTGTPKGVLISQRGVIDYIEWAREVYSVTENDIIGNQAPFYFDNSTLDIYLMIVTGAKLNIIPEDRFTFPIKLIEYINEKHINFVFWVPSVLNSISNFDAFSSVLPTSLNKILFAGEAMPNKHLNYWRSKYPNALYSNLYGPTEITVDCTYYIVDRSFNDDDPLPIGKACKNTQVLIFSDSGNIVEVGEIGELCVRGTSLAFGYYNDFEKSESVFVQNPLHNFYSDKIYKTGDLVYENNLGELIFVGRKDSQIKHMGYRIELGEIETAIHGIDGIKNVCVLYDNKQSQIVCFYIGDISFADVRKYLLDILPKYMIPTKWILEKEFPFNANGKIDRLNLFSKI